MSETAPTPPNPFDPVPKVDESTANNAPSKPLIICQPRAGISEVPEPDPTLNNTPLGQPTSTDNSRPPATAVQVQKTTPSPGIPWETDPGEEHIGRGND